MRHLHPSTLIRIGVYGGFVVLAASTWAWALGFDPWHGAAVGAVLGLVFGFCVAKLIESFEGDGLEALGRFTVGMWSILFFSALSIAGAIVGLVLRFFDFL